MLTTVNQIAASSSAFPRTCNLMHSIGRIFSMANLTRSIYFPRERVSKSSLITCLRAIVGKFPVHSTWLKFMFAPFTNSHLKNRFYDFSLSAKAYCCILVDKICKTTDRLLRIKGQLPNHFVSIDTRFGWDDILQIQQKSLRPYNPKRIPECRAIPANSAIAIEVPPNKCTRQRSFDARKSQVVGFVGDDSKSTQTANERLGADDKTCKVKPSGWISIIIPPYRLIRIKGFTEFLKMFTIFPRQVKHQRRSHNRSIGRDKAQPVGFFVEVDGIEVGTINPISNWTMGSHGFNVSTWMAGSQVLLGR